MPTGFPSDVDVTDIEGIEPLPSDTAPLADAMRMLHALTDGKSATDFGIRYKSCVTDDERGNYLYGDIHTAYCRVRDGYNRCLLEDNSVSEHRVDVPEHERYKASTEQVEGYLSYAIDFLDDAFARFDDDCGCSECANLKRELERAQDIIETHRRAAQNGTVYAGPPADSIL